MNSQPLHRHPVSSILNPVIIYMVSVKYKIFCMWIWFATSLYLINISTFSPLYLSILALIFTIPFNIFNDFKKRTTFFKIYIILFELIVVLSNAYKHFLVDKKPLVSRPDIALSIILFALYLVYLHLLNTNMYKVYFVDLLKY